MGPMRRIDPDCLIGTDHDLPRAVRAREAAAGRGWDCARVNIGPAMPGGVDLDGLRGREPRTLGDPVSEVQTGDRSSTGIRWLATSPPPR